VVIAFICRQMSCGTESNNNLIVKLLHTLFNRSSILSTLKDARSSFSKLCQK